MEPESYEQAKASTGYVNPPQPGMMAQKQTEYEMMSRFSAELDRLEIELNLLEGAISPILLPDSDVGHSQPAEAPYNALHTEIQRLGYRVDRLMMIRQRIRL